MNPVETIPGESPVILAMPHTGLYVPDEVKASLNDTGQALADTDWYVDRLYQDLLPGATIVRATFHRYVIDANRDPTGVSLYPGQNTTKLCPTIDFLNVPIYRDKCEPDDEEIERRRAAFHAPYHEALKTEIERVRATYGLAVLYDCHSIRSEVPFLFEGKLPDFNIGTNHGVTCDRKIEQEVFETCTAAEGYSSVLNGRFKGGWTTRHYGQPSRGIHAIQMELAQSTYMSETVPWEYLPALATRVRPHLKAVLDGIQDMARNLASELRD